MDSGGDSLALDSGRAKLLQFGWVGAEVGQTSHGMSSTSSKPHTCQSLLHASSGESGS